MDMQTLSTQATRSQRDLAPVVTELGGEYLAFRLCGQEYAADILIVQEIRNH